MGLNSWAPEPRQVDAENVPIAEALGGGEVSNEDCLVQTVSADVEVLMSVTEFMPGPLFLCDI